MVMIHGAAAAAVVVFFYWYLILGVSAKRGRRIDIFSEGGDIKQLQRLNGRPRVYSALPKGSAMKWDKLRDTNGYYVIPYVISGQYDSEERQIIAGAVKAIEKNTCIRFKKRIREFSYIDLQNKYSEGCYTSVGRFPGRNVVMLEANNAVTCIEHEIVLHELLHAVGLWHEHMRSDRDDFIKVHYENIQPGMYAQFEKIPATNGDTYGIPYDYRSVMHYAKDAFARRHGVVTMETINPKFQDIIGRVHDAAASDYYKVCALYECPVCIRKSFDLKEVQEGKFSKISENEVFPSAFDDADNYVSINDPYSFIRKAQSIFGWLVSFVMN